jgi:sugar phosphate isomerase/epimerase
MASVIAAQGYTVREFAKTPGDVLKTCQKLRKIGFTAVQVSAWAALEPAEMAKILSGEGLVCCATHSGFDQMLTAPEKVAADHRTLGCRHTAPGSMPNNYRTGDGYARFAQDASAAGKKLRSLGLTLSYHNHAFEMEKQTSDPQKRVGLDILIQDSDPAALNFEIDTYWIQAGGGDPAAWIRKVKGRIPLVHLKDMTIRANQPIFAEVGEGNLNWAAILPACKEAGVEWYIIEEDQCERDPFESLAISRRNLLAMGLS